VLWDIQQVAGKDQLVVRVAEAMVETSEGTIRLRGSEATHNVAAHAYRFGIFMSFLT
jgi:hypothetical protein